MSLSGCGDQVRALYYNLDGIRNDDHNTGLGSANNLFIEATETGLGRRGLEAMRGPTHFFIAGDRTCPHNLARGMCSRVVFAGLGNSQGFSSYCEFSGAVSGQVCACMKVCAPLSQDI